MALIKALFDQSLISSAEGFDQADITSSDMRESIKTWFKEYFKREPDEIEDPCQRLPYAIVNKLTKTTFAEYDSSIKDTKSAKAAWQDANRQAFDMVKQAIMQWALIGGECLIKPVPFNGHFTFTVIRRDWYVVLGRAPGGLITSVGTAEFCHEAGSYYTLLEKRSVDSAGYLTIENKLFRSWSASSIGVRVALSSLERYSALPDTYTYPVKIGNIGLVPVRLPTANCVDGSPDGVSVFEPAMGLIHNANVNERQLYDEFANGASRIVVSEDLMLPDEYGHKKLVGKVFVGVPDMPQNVGINIFSPALRDANYENRKQSYLRSCESLIGLKRGILSNVEAAERTATEITSSEGDYSLTIGELQSMYYDALREALRLCDLLGQMYKLCDSSHFDLDSLAVTWGNGILYDARQEWEDDLAAVAAGLLRPELALAHKYDLACDTPEDLKKIREAYMPELEQLT